MYSTLCPFWDTLTIHYTEKYNKTCLLLLLLLLLLVFFHDLCICVMYFYILLHCILYSVCTIVRLPLLDLTWLIHRDHEGCRGGGVCFCQKKIGMLYLFKWIIIFGDIELLCFDCSLHHLRITVKQDKPGSSTKRPLTLLQKTSASVPCR